MRYDKETVENMLATKKMGHPLYFYHETDSTRFRMRTLALEGAKEGTLVLAECQTVGRGRKERVWEAPPKSGIWMSLLLRPTCHPSKISAVTLLTAIALAEAIEEASGVLTEIKWPNDILVRGKKLVGILTEMDCDMEKIHFVTVGIGVNVNTKIFSQELWEIATSLYLETGREFERTEILEKIMTRFTELYELFCAADADFAPFRQRYLAKCTHIGKEVKVIAEEIYVAQALDITENGELLVKRKDTGETIILCSGEVSIREKEK